jgi:hypothetical protein
MNIVFFHVWVSGLSWQIDGVRCSCRPVVGRRKLFRTCPRLMADHASPSPAPKHKPPLLSISFNLLIFVPSLSWQARSFFMGKVRQRSVFSREFFFLCRLMIISHLIVEKPELTGAEGVLPVKIDEDKCQNTSFLVLCKFPRSCPEPVLAKSSSFNDHQKNSIGNN